MFTSKRPKLKTIFRGIHSPQHSMNTFTKHRSALGPGKVGSEIVLLGLPFFLFSFFFCISLLQIIQWPFSPQKFPNFQRPWPKCHFPPTLQTEKRHLISPKVLPILKASMNPSKVLVPSNIFGFWSQAPLPLLSFHSGWVHYPFSTFTLGGSTTPSPLSVWVGPLPHPHFQSGWVH